MNFFYFRIPTKIMDISRISNAGSACLVGIIRVIILTILLLFYSNYSLSAQNYTSLAGLRLGTPLSISYKTIIKENKAIEGYLGTRGKDGYRFVNLSGAYQIIEPLDLWGVEELYYYYGAGASIYFWSFEEEGNNQSLSPGFQGYLGLEYTFADRPINITLDWRPTIFISGDLSGLRAGYLALGVRYVLNRSAKEGNLEVE